MGNETKSNKRKLSSLGSAIYSRQRSWLRRGEPGVKAESWRPKKVHRVNAKHWLAATDNQLRISTSAEGWKTFAYAETKETWAASNWPRWPWMGISLDQGSDGVAATYALEYKFRCNVSKFGDFGHGAHKDVQVALRSAALFDYALVFMVSANVLHGPFSDDQRFHQIRDAMKLAYRDLSEETPLFADLAPLIHAELKAGGHEFPNEQSNLRETWEYCRSQDPFSRKGYRLNLNRFQGFLQVAEEVALPRWWLDLWERSFVCIECDMLGSKAVSKLLLRPGPGEAFGEGGGTTSSNQVTLEDRSFRSGLQNALVVSTLYLSDRVNRRRLKLIVAIARHVRLWHGQQSKELRSASASLEWMLDQVGRGELYRHVNAMLAALGNEAVLDDCEFCVDADTAPIGMKPSNYVVIVDDELSETMGQFCLALVAARIRRCLGILQGWPHRMIAALIPEKTADTIMQFQEDWAIFEEYRAWPGQRKVDKIIIGRSALNLVVNKQLAAALDDTGSTMTVQLAEMIRGHNTGIISTQIVEDLIGVQKNNTEVKGANRFRRPERAMCKSIVSNVVDQRHRYAPVVGAAAGQISATLALDAWRSCPKRWSLPFGEVQGAESTPPWYSGSATNFCVRDADLQMLRDAKAAGNFKLARMCWLGEIFDVKHHLCFSRKNSAGAVEHFIGLYHFSDSAVVALKVELRPVVGTNHKWLEPVSIDGPCLVTIFDLDTEGPIKGSIYCWKSWLAQQMEYPGAASTLSPAIRMFVDGVFLPVKELAARNAFWCMPKSEVAKYCAYWGVHLDANASTYEVVHQAVMECLKVDDAKACDICHRRLVNLDRASIFNQEIAQVDAAIETFDKNDQDDVNRAIARAERHKQERSAYSKEYVARKGAYVKAAAGKKKPVDPKYPPLPSTIPQAHARQFVPPGAHIWRALVRSEWAGHLRPYTRVSAPWRVHGEEEALRVVLRKLWVQWLEFNGRDAASCPVKGLFVAEETVADAD